MTATSTTALLPSVNELALETLVIALYALVLSSVALAINGVSRLHRGIAVGFVGTALLAIAAGVLLNHQASDLALLAAASAIALSAGAHITATPAVPRETSLRTWD